MKKIGLISLGCAKNLVDSENILGLLQDDGYTIVNNVRDSDIVIVNTCGFIDASKKESITTIFEMIDKGKQVVVTGCLAQRYEKELTKEIPEATFIPIRSYNEFNKFLQKVDPSLSRCDGIDDHYRLISTGSYSAYLKIGEGCDNRCSYCAIPIIRGGFVSRPYEDIMEEAHKLADSGIKEIIVLQQDTTKYGIDRKQDGHNIVSLLKGLLAIKEFAYIRLLYLYPDEISDELIDLIASEKRLTPYFDVPIQHSEDHILKDMNRRGNKEFLKDLFTKIRNKVSTAILRTTVMVGFPGETEEDVDNLITFLQDIKFDHVGAFTYSREEGTRAYHFKPQISEKVKKQRLKRVMQAQQKISYQQNKKHIGEIMEGLIVGQENGYYLLRSYWNAPDDVDGKIFFKADKTLKEGNKVTVKIEDAFVYDLMGSYIEEKIQD